MAEKWQVYRPEPHVEIGAHEDWVISAPDRTRLASAAPQSVKPPVGRLDEPVGSRTKPRTVMVTIDDRKVEVPVGTSILDAAKIAGRHIPTLCAHPDLPAVGECRICMVEVEGQWALQASCAFPITDPVNIRTYSKRVREARTAVVDLLLSEHYGDCRTCGRNGNCELQDLAREYASDTPRFGTKTCPGYRVDKFGPAVVRDMDKCVQCTRCVRTCAELQGVNVLGVLGRGDHTTIGTYLDLPLDLVTCINCGQCINRCPTGALQELDETAKLWAAIEDPTKTVVIQTAPAPRAAIGEEFGLVPGTPVTWKLNTALKAIGIDKVFDTNFTADLTIIEEATELLGRLYANLVDNDSSRPLPMYTSCSPGWIKLIEHRYPQALDHLSSCKSPQQMFGTLIKTWYAERENIDPANIVSVSLMPCSAKKFEAARPEMADSGERDVDIVLTTREMARMIKEYGIHLPDLPDSQFDSMFGATGSGVIFGASGGVMEAALRTTVELLTGSPVEDVFAGANITDVRGFKGVKMMSVTLPEQLGPVPELLSGLFDSFDWLAGATVKVAVVHGGANALKALENITAGGELAECHFIEFMACPGGCLGGGGQPLPTSKAIRAARADAIYAEDSRYGQLRKPRKSHENQGVLQLYSEFLTGGPGGAEAHHLLHTTYTPRGTSLPAQANSDVIVPHDHNKAPAAKEDLNLHRAPELVDH